MKNPDHLRLVSASAKADKYINKDGSAAKRVAPKTATALDQVETFIRRYVVYPNDHAAAAHALWIVHTHLMDIWFATPRLIFASNAPASGKTRALEVSELLVPHPELSANSSAAAIVRTIAMARDEDQTEITVLYDELDLTLSKSEEGTADLRSALNAGYRRNGRFKRCINSGANVADFACYAALACASLRFEALPEALLSRAIIIAMKPRTNDEPLEEFDEEEVPNQAAPIFDAVFEWCEHHKTAIQNNRRPDMPVRDRAKEIWKPLIRIADVAGGDWPDRAREAAVFLTQKGKAVTAKSGSDTELLIHIKEAFLDADRIHTSTLIQRLKDREDSPWADMKRPLTGNALAERLRFYDIHPVGIKISGLNRNGYHKADFEDAWKHYVQVGSTGSTGSTKLSNKDKKVEAVEAVDPNPTEAEDFDAVDEEV